MRKNFYKYLTKLFKENEKINILLGDIGVFSLKDAFNHDSSRAYNFGIMEQTMIGAACGLSKSGFIPFIHSIAPFITERSYEQIKLNLGYENVNAFIVSVGNSYDYASLGCTHHCPNDLHIISCIPNFKTYCPGNSKDVENIILENLHINQPKYIRLSEVENNLDLIKENYEDLEILKLSTNGICIVVGNAIKDFNKILNLNCTILYTTKISDFDILKLNDIICKNNIDKNISVIEPCYDSGIISKIATSISEIKQLNSISIPKEFIEIYGTKKEIDESIGLDDDSILKKLIKIYETRN